MSEKKHLRVTVVSAKFNSKKPCMSFHSVEKKTLISANKISIKLSNFFLVSKFQVKFAAGGVTAQTKVVNLKQKTLNPVFNEEIDMQIDINAKFSIGILSFLAFSFLLFLSKSL